LEARSGQRGAPVFDAVPEPGGEGWRPRHCPPVSAREDPPTAWAGRALGALLAANLCAAAALAAAQSTPEIPSAAPPLLEPGQPITTSFEAGDSRSYLFDLEPGRFARVEVEQRGIDVVAILISPAGETLVEADGPDGASGFENTSALAETAAEAGRFRVEVRSLDPSASPGEIRVVLAEERPAKPDDGDRVTAERADYEALALWGRGSAEASRRAIERFEQALEIWQRVDDRRRMAETSTHLGAVHHTLGEINRELEYLERALPLWRELGETDREAVVLNNLGLAYSRLGHTEKSLAATERAAELFRELGDRRNEAVALNVLGHAYLRTGIDLAKAREYFERSLAIRREVGDRPGEGRTLQGLGMVHNRRGDSEAAIEAYGRALELARETGDREAQASALNNLTSVYDRIGEFERSLEHHQEALSLTRALGDRRGQAYVLSNIGSLYIALGDIEGGLDSIRDSLRLFETVEDRWAQASAHHMIGWCHLALDRPEESLGHVERGLSIARELDDRRRTAQALATLASVRIELGDPEAAVGPAEEALAAAREAGLRAVEADALVVLAEVRLTLGRPEAAIELIEQAIAIEHEIGNRPAEAQGLVDLARAERALGRLDDAHRHFQTAVEYLESVRTAVGARDLRATYLASKHDYYREWIALLMDLHRRQPDSGWDARALGVAERARARTLLDALAGIEAEVRSGLDPVLAAEEERLRHRLNALETDRQTAAAKDDTAAAAAAAQEIRTLAGEYRALEARIRNANPRYADLVQPKPLDAAAIQAGVLEPGTLLLQYSLGEQQSWLWAVSRETLAAFELPPQAEIEARALRLYDLLTARNLEPADETPAERAHRIAAADAELPAAATVLADAVIGPVRARLAADDAPSRLVVVADGALHYVPFAALPSQRGEPLLFGHELVSAPSASALAVLRRELAGRNPAPRTLAVLADPVFDAGDPRVRTARERMASAPDDGGQTQRGGSFRRLRFSRDEARKIADLVPDDQRLVAFDFEASRETATDGLLARYRMVHFATHGVLNTDYPALSGLVLSLVDDRGEPREGFLRLHDIYGLELAADLVTLSACETALGREIRGEGLVGLARGFMYAGAARVVASLWSVQDRATAETMRYFYQAMLDRGLAPAAALREAQMTMAREERWAAPYYWAPFVLHGEWR